MLIDDRTEEHLALLIAALPPAPPSSVQAATQLPRARAAIDELVARASAEKDARGTILGDVEKALLDAGIEPRPHLVQTLRQLLGSPEG